MDHWLTLSLSSGKPLGVDLRGKDGSAIDLLSVESVYFRDPRIPSVSGVIKEHQGFAQREIAEQLRSLWRALEGARWLNHPKNLWLASNKFEQLIAASRIGFLIPETLITADREDALRLFSRCDGDVIVKAVRNGFEMTDRRVLFAPTRRVNKSDLQGLLDYAQIPATYQSRIDKLYDVRVTIVGENIFSTAIYSQKHKETQTDWRTWDIYDFDLEHQAISLPSEVDQKCFDIARHFGLRYAAIDLILSKQSEYYFLEINPNGQWAWLEEKAGHPIRDEIIKNLTGEEM